MKDFILFSFLLRPLPLVELPSEKQLELFERDCGEEKRERDGEFESWPVLFRFSLFLGLNNGVSKFFGSPHQWIFKARLVGLPD